MNIFVFFRSSARTLKKHSIRSFLTILGIMIGIAAIIITFSIGRGAEKAVRSQIVSLGENSIYIFPSAFIKHAALRGSPGFAQLRKRDIKAIEDQSPEVQEISPMHMTAQTAQFAGSTAKQSVIGCYPNMPKIEGSVIERGTFFNDYHLRVRSNVAVLGSKSAKNLFKNKDPIGQTILINRKPCRVIGILKKRTQYFGPWDPNERIYVPYTTSKKLFRVQDEAEDEITAMVIRIYSGSDSSIFRRKVKRILRFTHQTQEDEEDPFTILDQQSIDKIARDSAAIIRLFGLIAASISLIVGSIGVMNIMLVSVQERTREIGLRMAIGATQRLIQLQFLVESTTLTLVGGSIGIILGLIGQFVVGYASNLSPITEIGPLIICLLVTVLIGVFFGYYPAYQASKLNPVDALLQQT